MTTISLNGIPFSSQTVQVNGGRLHYVTGGQGEPLLLWHGFLGTWYSWRNIMPDLARYYTLIVPDMRGYGDSNKPATGYDAQTLMHDFRALVQRLGYASVRIAAHDMGAPPALLWAGSYPNEVRALAYLEEPVFTKDTLAKVLAFTPETTQNGGLWWWSMALAGDMAERLIPGHERAFLTWFYEHYTANPAAIDEVAIIEYLRSFAGPGGISGALGVYRAIWDSVAQTEPLLKQPVTVPILGVGSEAVQGEQVGQMLQTVATNVQTSVIAGSGHFPAEEQPGALTQALLAFFGQPT